MKIEKDCVARFHYTLGEVGETFAVDMAAADAYGERRDGLTY
jgi:hypothetical protein